MPSNDVLWLTLPDRYHDRDKFEDAVIELGAHIGRLPRGAYTDPYTTAAWTGWQLRAAYNAKVDRIAETIGAIEKASAGLNIGKCQNCGHEHECPNAVGKRSENTEDENPEDLYARLASLSKSLEGSGRIDEHDNPSAYATVLDAMNFVRAGCKRNG